MNRAAIESTPCPKCKRPNASYKITCLYCGQTMPNPTKEPPRPPARKKNDPQLDTLIRQAMSGKGDIRQLKAALESQRLAKTATEGAVKQTKVAEESLVQKPGTPPRKKNPSIQHKERNDTATEQGNNTAKTSMALSQLQQKVDRALARWHAKDKNETILALIESQKIVQSLYKDLGISEESAPKAEESSEQIPPSSRSISLSEAFYARANGPEVEPVPKAMSVTLPSYQNAYVLTVDGPGDPTMGKVLSEMLEVDVVTARLHAASRHVRAVLRGNDRRALARLADQVNQHTPLTAAVLAYASVRDLPPHLTVLSRDSDSFEVMDDPIWLTDYQPNTSTPSRRVLARTFDLAVPGEVIIRTYKEDAGRSSLKGKRLTDEPRSHEKRIHVLDLYGDSRSFRIILGVTNYEYLPGYNESSALLSHTGMIDWLKNNPGTRTEGNRLCRPRVGSKPRAQGNQQNRLLTGWPSWEEHSRTCLLHHRQR